MARRDDEQVEIPDTTGVRESDSGLALLVSIEGKTHWIPKKLIHDDSETYKKGISGTLVVPEWFALKEGLI